MMKLIVIATLLVILGGGGYFAYTKLNQPSGPSYPQKGKGYPTQQLNGAADQSRKADIEILGQGLKKYYSQYNKAPDNLDELVKIGWLPNIPLDPLTKTEPNYYPSDEQFGCRVESQLSNGLFAKSYCK